MTERENTKTKIVMPRHLVFKMMLRKYRRDLDKAFVKGPKYCEENAHELDKKLYTIQLVQTLQRFGVINNYI